MKTGWGNKGEGPSYAPHNLALAALMKTGWGSEGEGLDLDKLAPEAAAEYLWRRFTSRLG